MLHGYQAELNGSQLTWIDQPPALADLRRVLVVVDDRSQFLKASTQVADAPDDAYAAFLRAKGCLGKASRAQIDAELAALRDEWDRPLSM